MIVLDRENMPPFPPGARLNRRRKCSCISSVTVVYMTPTVLFPLHFALLLILLSLGTGYLLYVLPWVLVSWCGLEVCHLCSSGFSGEPKLRIILPQQIFPFPCHTGTWVDHAWELVYYCFPNHFQRPSVNLSVSRKRNLFTHPSAIGWGLLFLDWVSVGVTSSLHHLKCFLLSVLA